MVLSILEECGLTRNEAKLYLLLLDLGATSTGALIRKSGFQSSVVYHLLSRLVEKGVVTFVKNGEIKYFSAADPTNLRQLLEQQEERIVETKKKFEELLPDLQSKRQQLRGNNFVQIYSGKSGLKTAFNDILNTANEYLVYGGTGNFSRLLPAYQKFFQNERIRKEIRQRNLWFGEKMRDDTTFEKTKYLGPSNNLPFSFVIYNDKVLINLFEEEPTTSIMIESKTLAAACTNFFEDLWLKSTE